MFSIVILDTILQKLVFINDRLGVKPLYNKNDVLIFASELKAILEYRGFNSIFPIWIYSTSTINIWRYKKNRTWNIMIYDLDNRKLEVKKNNQ